jgi:hypothetical protein
MAQNKKVPVNTGNFHHTDDYLNVKDFIGANT